VLEDFSNPFLFVLDLISNLISNLGSIPFALPLPCWDLAYSAFSASPWPAAPAILWNARSELPVNEGRPARHKTSLNGFFYRSVSRLSFFPHILPTFSAGILISPPGGWNCGLDAS